MNLMRKCFAEFLGTYLLVLFGCGVVHSAVLTLFVVPALYGVSPPRASLSDGHAE